MKAPRDEAITIYVKSDDSAIKQRREGVACRVREYFMSNCDVPAHLRAICFLDDRDADEIRGELGPSNRGLHWPIRGQGLGMWPSYMWGVVAAMDYSTGDCRWPFASVIYLHGSTCENDLALTTTLAHELQHFLQYANCRRLWAINVFLMSLLKPEKPHLRRVWDIPTEREARIVSKTAAEALHGIRVVEQYANERIETAVGEDDKEDWKFFQSIDCSIPYSAAESTSSLVDLYRAELQKLQMTPEWQKDPDFSSIDFADDN